MPISLIDVHSHTVLPSFSAALLGGRDAPADTAVIDGMPLPPWSVEQHLETMDANKIDVCILSLPEATQYLKGDEARGLVRRMNEDLAATVAGNPLRFGAMAVLPIGDIDAALDELAYALDVLKLDGVTLDTNHAGHYLGDPYFDPLLAELDRREATLFVHPTASPGFDAATSRLNIAALEFMFDTTRMIATMVLSGARRRYSKIDIIATHGDGTIPYLATRLGLISQMPWAFRGGPKQTTEEVLESLGSFHFDLTAATSATSLDALRKLVPPEQLLMGFDFPFMPPQTIAPAKASFANYVGFDESDKRKIEAHNALCLFPRLAGSAGEANRTLPEAPPR